VAALRAVAGFAPPEPPQVTRLAQGQLGADGQVADPLAPDRNATGTSAGPTGVAAPQASPGPVQETA